MKIIRYSIDGFKPKHQTHHLKHVDYDLNHFDISEFPEFLRQDILKRHNYLTNFYKENINLLQFGVWAFIDGHKNNQALNHLKRRVPCWEAEIANDTIVVGVNWDHLMKISDPECKIFGFYIPESNMKNIFNIKKR